jgi:putative thioredoxin
VAQPQAPLVFEVSAADFERDVIQRSYEKPVVVDFWAPWCGPCRMLGPLLERLVAERKGAVLLAKVNIDEAQDLAIQFGVQSIPLVLAFRKGQVVLDFLGLLPEPQIRQFLDKISPTPADNLAEDARALEATDPDEAEGLYRRALAADSQNEEAAVGLARVLIARGQDDEARTLLSEVAATGPLEQELERLNAVLKLHELARGLGDEAAARKRLAADPKSARAQYDLGVILAATGRYEEALQQLLAAAERDPGLASSKVREAMVQVFQIVGPQSALANDYRNRLATLLY